MGFSDFHLFWNYCLKSVLILILIPIIGYFISEKFGYYEPEDDVIGGDAVTQLKKMQEKKQKFS